MTKPKDKPLTESQKDKKKAIEKHKVEMVDAKKRNSVGSSEKDRSRKLAKPGTKNDKPWVCRALR